MLEVEDVHSYYAGAHVLQGVTLRVPEGGVVALLGRNGMGKTTLVRSIMGTRPPTVRQGSIRLRAEELVGKPPHRVSQLGLGLVPQGRRIFRSLTVEENLTIAFRQPIRTGNARVRWDMDRVFELFPRLAERRRSRAGQLSGGERQMLAIGRALTTNPELVLMDEPSEGLAPMLVQQLRDQLAALKESGVSIFLVEQNVGLALAVADEVYIIDRGRIVYHSSPEELAGDEGAKRLYLGV
jgi:branched-chain amino acid transport system ATP-binding protein